MSKQEFMEWDEKAGGIVITSQETIRVDGVTGVEDALKKIDARLIDIVKTAKDLKLEAEALKSLKERLKAGVTTDSAPASPATEEEQSPSVVSPDPT
jgi:hypothetical protein